MNTETQISKEKIDSIEADLRMAEEVDRDDSELELKVAQDRIQSLEDELREQKDRFVRTLADMENMRKRQERERADLLKYASEKLLQDLLPVLDSFEKAAGVSVSDQADPLIQGIKMVHRQLLQILENHGLKVVEAAGQAFDPNIHQAIQRIEESGVTSEVIKDEYQKGYTLNGRLLRPSMVSVSVPSSESVGE